MKRHEVETNLRCRMFKLKSWIALNIGPMLMVVLPQGRLNPAGRVLICQPGTKNPAGWIKRSQSGSFLAIRRGLGGYSLSFIYRYIF